MEITLKEILTVAITLIVGGGAGIKIAPKFYMRGKGNPSANGLELRKHLMEMENDKKRDSKIEDLSFAVAETEKRVAVQETFCKEHSKSITLALSDGKRRFEKLDGCLESIEEKINNLCRKVDVLAVRIKNAGGGK